MGSPGCVQPLCPEAASSAGVNQPSSRCTLSAWLFVPGHGTKQLNGHLELTTSPGVPLFPITPEQAGGGTHRSSPEGCAGWGGPILLPTVGGEGDARCSPGRM